jgi:putative membrane protein
MALISQILTAVVIIEHLYFLWLEMFAWETRGPKVFKGCIEARVISTDKNTCCKPGFV